MAKALIQLKPNVADHSELELFSVELGAFGLNNPVTVDAPSAVNVLRTAACVDNPSLDLLITEVEHLTPPQGFPWGYLVEASRQSLQRLAKQSAFVLRVINLDTGCHANCEQRAVEPGQYAALELISSLAKKKANSLPPVLAYDDIWGFIRLEEAARSKGHKHLSEYLTLLKGRPVGPLSHDIHYYKAKFFPRFSRSLINSILPKHTTDGRVLDPFVGSGTTLLESTFLGYPSLGVDIDPLSILISRAKVLFLNLYPHDIGELIDAAERAAFYAAAGAMTLASTKPAVRLPDWLLKNRKMTQSARSMLEHEITFLRAFIDEAPTHLQDFAKVFASDAITRKVKMRILGTGSGRFSLDFSKRTTFEILIKSLTVHKQLAEALQWAKKANLLPMNTYSVQANVGDARELTYKEEIDAVLTSPPYLPASSGRESYAKHRTLSLLAINGQTVSDLDSLIKQSMGSAENPADSTSLREDLLRSLSDTERFIISWLQKDPLRRNKAPAFAQYFVDVRKSLAATHRALKPGSKAVFIVGKQSTFYEFSSKKPLLVVPLAEIFADSAQKVGFTIEKSIDIRLAKRTPNARPRSLDDYFETALILRK